MMDIYCINTQEKKEFNPGISYLEVFNALQVKMKATPLCVVSNGKLTGLESKVYENCDIKFLDVTNSMGARCYSQGLTFVLAKAVDELWPGGKIKVSNALSKGLFCPIEIGKSISKENVAAIKERMEQIIGQSIPFIRHTEHTKDVAQILANHGREETAQLLMSIGSLYSTYYTLGDMPDWYFGVLPPHTGCLKVFGLELKDNGVLLRVPTKHNPYELEPLVQQDKMFETFKEHHRWMNILKIPMLSKLNEAVQKDGNNHHRNSNLIVNIAEDLQSQKIVHIADQIVSRRKENSNLKFIMVSGPSSSGKTTFCKRLLIQLMAQGLTPKAISLDDYFVERMYTPRDENGDYDFESLYAIDLPLFNSQLNELLAGKTIQPPTFNFKKGGVREYTEPEMTLGPNDILLIEGIHALNPELISDIPSESRFLIYVSALTSIRIDDHNYIPTSDNRLLRRITRDNKYRGTSATDTIKRWPSVRAGEEKWIFPYQENADAMFNSAMMFEIAVIKDLVTPLLQEVPESSPEYAKATLLLNLLRLFKTIPSQNLPPTSLVREFIGDSSFHY